MFCFCNHSTGPVLPIAGCDICRPWHWPIVSISRTHISRELRMPKGGWTNTPPDGWKDELMPNAKVRGCAHHETLNGENKHG